MFDKPEIFGMAAQSAANAAARMGAIGRNIANSDTPGYRATDLKSFAETYRGGGDLTLNLTRAGHIGGMRSDQGAIPVALSGHMSPNGNNVSLEGEMMRAAAVRKDHDMAMSIYRTSLNILRASLGRR